MAVEVDIWRMINIKGQGAEQYNLDQAMALIMGPNVVPIKWYTSSGQPEVDPKLTAMAQELSDFASWYYETFMISTPYKEKREYFLEKFPVAVTGLFYAKSSVQSGGLGGSFGIGVQGSLHAQLIRPESVFDPNSPTTNTVTWQQTVSAAGWVTGYFKFNTTNSSVPTGGSNLANTLNRVNFLVFGLADQSAPSKLQAYRVNGTGQKPYGVEVANYLNFATQDSLINFPAAFYVKNNEVWSLDLEFNSTGTTYIFPQGIQFVNTDYYQIE